MLKLGDFYEDEAKEVAKYLRDAGMKVDIRTYIEGWSQEYNYLEGRLSDLKGKIDDEEFADHERYLASLKAILAKGATLETFERMFEVEFDPEVDEKRERVKDMVEGNQPDDSGLSEEKRIQAWSDVSNLMTDLTKISNGKSFAARLLDRNEIKFGEEVGNRLDDPIAQILVNPGEIDDGWTVRTTTVYTFKPMADIYIDEFSATLFEDLDEEFKDLYYEELLTIQYIADIILNLVDSSSGKMEMENFTKKCATRTKYDEDVLVIDGTYASLEIAKSLEKNGILKIKGNTIKWKR